MNEEEIPGENKRVQENNSVLSKQQQRQQESNNEQEKVISHKGILNQLKRKEQNVSKQIEIIYIVILVIAILLLLVNFM